MAAIQTDPGTVDLFGPVKLDDLHCLWVALLQLCGSAHGCSAFDSMLQELVKVDAVLSIEEDLHSSFSL